MSMSAGDSRPYLCKLLELLDAPHELQTWLDAERVKVEAGDDSVYDAMHTAIDCCEHEEQTQQAQAARLAAALAPRIQSALCACCGKDPEYCICDPE